MPALSAASMMVAPSGTVTVTPSIVSVTSAISVHLAFVYSDFVKYCAIRS